MSDNVKIGTFMLKISKLLLLKDFGKKISVSRELDVFVKPLATTKSIWGQTQRTSWIFTVVAFSQ